MNLYKEAQDLFSFTQAIRRDIHMHPELGFEEFRTAEIVSKELNGLGIEVQTGVGKTGVVGLIQSIQPGPTVLLRFDMDALPVTEDTNAAYASKTEGVMHACGHDGHIAIGLSVAKLLVKHKAEWCGTIKLVFQPAEEGLGGAESMIEDGVLENPKPDFSLALHLWNERPIGEICVTPGPAMAGAEAFTISVLGKGAHGAQPHQGLDPILASSHIITALQSIVSRNVPPLETAVLSVATIHGGKAFNVIPPKVEMKGTIRTYLPEIRILVIDRMREIVTGVAESMGCRVTISIDQTIPAVINDLKISQKIQTIVGEVLPDDRLITDERTMGSEDMAFMMKEVPGCYMFIGSNNKERGLIFGHHHPKFDFDEAALPRGVALMTGAAMKLLQS
ncbi:MAG: M20 family metallopeptidase [Anaerolineales bacterium]